MNGAGELYLSSSISLFIKKHIIRVLISINIQTKIQQDEDRAIIEEIKIIIDTIPFNLQLRKCCILYKLKRLYFYKTKNRKK